MTKKKIGTVWLGGCSGCHMSFLDLDERLLEVFRLADIVKCPVVDGKEFPAVDVALVEGAVASQEHLDEIQHIRKVAKILVSFGDCAVSGNVTALRNPHPVQDTLELSYKELPSNDNPEGVLPRAVIAPLIAPVRPLHDVVKVDYVIPGCPPSADLIYYVLSEILQDRVPSLEKGNIKYG